MTKPDDKTKKTGWNKLKAMLFDLLTHEPYQPSDLVKETQPHAFDDGSFEKFGLLAERRPDGTMACNLKIVGGQAGQYVDAQWMAPGPQRLHLALTVVLRMCAYPSDKHSPMAKFMTASYNSQQFAALMLDCGTQFQPKHVKLARLFESQYLANSGEPDVLSIPYEDIAKSLRIYIQEVYPERTFEA